MKKYIGLLLFTAFCSITHAQFTLTPTGFVPTDHPENDYVVYEFKGKIQSELYRSVILFINATYNSPQDILSEVPEDMITIKGIEPNVAKLRRYRNLFDLHYTLTLRFKDEKIRIDKPSYECSSIDEFGSSMITLTEKRGTKSPVLHRIFNPKNGKVEEENVKSQLETFFNDLSNRIINSVETGAEADW